jgi:hypothetical protein
MKKLLFLSALLSMLQVNSYANEVEYSGIVEVMPGNVLLSSELSDLNFISTSNGSYVSDGVSSDATYAPSISAGLNATDGVYVFHLLGGYSRLVNGDFSANMLKLEAAAYYRGSYSNKFAIGAHITAMSFMSPDWSGAGEVEFSDTNAIAPGISILFGNEFKVKASVDYLLGSSMDITTGANTTSSESSVSLDGVMFQLGLIYVF